jgi:hypothetical protein
MATESTESTEKSNEVKSEKKKPAMAMEAHRNTSKFSRRMRRAHRGY